MDGKMMEPTDEDDGRDELWEMEESGDLDLG